MLENKLNDYLYNALIGLKLSFKNWYETGDLKIVSKNQKYRLQHDRLKLVSKELGFDPILSHRMGKLDITRAENSDPNIRYIYTTDMQKESVSNQDMNINLFFNFSTLTSDFRITSKISIIRLVNIVILKNENYNILDKTSPLYQKIRSEYPYDITKIENQIKLFFKDKNISSTLNKNFTSGVDIIYVLAKSFYELQDYSTGISFNLYFHKTGQEFSMVWKVLLLDHIWSLSSTDIDESKLILPSWTLSITNIKFI